MNINNIKLAAQKMQDVLFRTPIVPAPWLSKKIRGTVYLKLENLQYTSSFKPRGALIKMLNLTPEQKDKGIVAMSAGNHAQGVAFHAQRMGIPATIIMPESTPIAKVERTRNLGAIVVLSGSNLAESELTALEFVEKGLTLIHPYDDEDIITGQGTVALEMLEDRPDIDTLIIPVGGGGLASGCSIAAKALNPNIKIYGVQSTACPAMIHTLYPERWFMPPDSSSLPLAEGIAVKNPGMITREILKTHLTDILAVEDTEIEDAVDALAMGAKVVAEGAGAAAVAALIKNPDLFYGKTVGIIVCGGNIDSRVFSSLIMHSLVRQEKFIRIKIKIPDTAGTLAKVTGIIGHLGGNIFELIHQRHFTNYSSKMTVLEVTIETRGRDHSQQIIQELINEGFPTSFYRT
ncbi:threonine ammonia-lyase [Candidatus Odyssella acanthamoebae]|uniref:Threonine dehydratase n=1 Tax=Candidatus Odyssella acanthamoebae TaxID=91604 RepID=A0A077ARR2_9PROT|nr:threonine ammonia-lyase [Candidatus Paracaedibacter acanthamoebae]AIK95882.1 threonine dehydratase [Candidatus Paracaedibacter acanthamoebae]